MTASYIICATPRSGSNVLCEMLASLGFAGNPGEHLWDPPGSDGESLEERWPRVLQIGTGETGVFALKLMWDQAERLERELPAILGMSSMPLSAVLYSTLNDPKYIYLTREDHVRQAISLTRAIQTNQWRSMDPAGETCQYDADAITHGIEFLAADEANWEAIFARHGIEPCRLTYEQLDSSPGAAIFSLLNFLGYSSPDPVFLTKTAHRRQADEVTEE